MSYRINDLVEDFEGDKAVIKGLDPVALEWDCRPGQVVIPDPSFVEQGLTNLSERVREWDRCIDIVDHEHCREAGKCWQDREPCPALETS